ncbi:MAG: DUF5684 domain-containing protein [Myxococcales bacterium]|jgi:hypothetical protein
MLDQADLVLQQAMSQLEVQSSPGGGNQLTLTIGSILGIIGMWKVFAKAGKPGWAAIIPIYNLIVLLQVVGRPVWWLVLLLIPLVNIVILILLMSDLAKAFGKGIGFTVGLILLNGIFMLILGFGDAQYQGGGGAPSAPAPA